MKHLSSLSILAISLIGLCSCDRNELKADLPSPEISISEIGTDCFTASWSEVSGADGYSYTLDNSVEFTTTGTSASFNQLEAGKTYTFRVKATGGASFSEWSETQVKLLDGALQSPVPTVTGKTTDSFTVSWEKVENATGYEYRIDGGEAVSTGELSVTITKDGNGNALLPGTGYTFSIRALSGNPDYADSGWLELLVNTEYPPFTADLDISLSEETSCGFKMSIVPNGDIEEYYTTLTLSEGFDTMMELYGKEEIIAYILDNIESGAIGRYTGPMSMTVDLLKPETGYVVMAVGFDRFGRYDLFHAKTTTLKEDVPVIGDELFEKLQGTWTGTQMGYAFDVPYPSETNPDPEPVIMNTEAVEATFDVSIVLNEGDHISYRERNQACIQFKSFTAGNLSLGYKSIEELIGLGYSEKNAILGYGPKALIDVKEDGSMEIEGLYSDVPAYTWDERYHNDVTFMNITCDPADSFMPSGDSLPLKVELSADGNTLTISGSYGPGFRYQRSASAGPLWCAAGSMVLTRKTSGQSMKVLEFRYQ